QIGEMARDPADFAMSRHVYARLSGQGFEIKVPLGEEAIDDGVVARIRARFHAAYKEIYGAVDEQAPVEVIDWNVAGVRDRGQALRYADDARANAGKLDTRRRAYFPEVGGYVECPVYSRNALPVG